MTPCRKTSRPPSHALKLRSRRMQCRAARYAALLLLFCVISPIHAAVQSSGVAGGAVATIAPALALRTRQRQKIIVGSAVNHTAELECSVRILRFFRYQKCDFLRVFWNDVSKTLVLNPSKWVHIQPYRASPKKRPPGFIINISKQLAFETKYLAGLWR